MTVLAQHLYLSRIAGPQAFQTVLGIVRQARANNERNGVTGLIVFDGEQICQYLEGEPDTLSMLVAAIEVDPRHDRVRVLHSGPLDARRFARFSMGYLMLDDGRDLEQFGSQSGIDAVRDLLAVLPRIDMEP